MQVEVGNTHTIEGYRDPTSDNPELVRFRPITGERTTTMMLSDDSDLGASLQDVIALLSHHMQQGEKPDWVECSNPAFTRLLLEHFQLNQSASVRPAGWGADDKANL